MRYPDRECEANSCAIQGVYTSEDLKCVAVNENDLLCVRGIK